MNLTVFFMDFFGGGSNYCFKPSKVIAFLTVRLKIGLQKGKDKFVVACWRVVWSTTWIGICEYGFLESPSLVCLKAYICHS